MPDDTQSGISQRQFYDAMQAIRDLIDTRHKSMRELIESRIEQLTHAMAEHVHADDLVEHRVTIIETQRGEESKQSVKRGAWAGFWAAAGITTLLELMRVLFHRP